jgi:ribonuclease BN (tRNA processing enzyme)
MGMKIRVLGTRGEIPQSAPYHSRRSGLLVDDRLMLDLGEKDFLRHRPEAVIFSHLHRDHAFFMRAPDKAPRIDIPMYGPEAYRRGNIEVLKLARSARIAGYNIRTIPTVHSYKVKSFAMVVSRGKSRFLYTGDLLWMKKWYRRYFKGLDLVISEASFIRKSGMVRREKKTGRLFGHAGVGRLIETFAPFAPRILLVHFGSWFYQDVKGARRRVARLGRQAGVRVEVGYDGLKLDV